MICHGSIWHSLVWDTPRPSSLFGRLRSLSTSTSLPLFAVFSRSPPQLRLAKSITVPWPGGQLVSGQTSSGNPLDVWNIIKAQARQAAVSQHNISTPLLLCEAIMVSIRTRGDHDPPLGQDMGSSSRSYCLITPSCRYPPAISLMTR